MIFENKRFLVGGMLSDHTRVEIKAKAEWFNIDCIRLVDSVMFILPYTEKIETDEGDRLLKYIFEKNKASGLPTPHLDWADSKFPVLCLYYYIMKSLNRESPVKYLRSKIKIDGKYATIINTDGQGTDR